MTLHTMLAVSSVIRVQVFDFTVTIANSLLSSLPWGVLRFHTHPLLLVPEQQFAASFIELQPVDLGVVADGSQIVALH